MSPIEAQPEFDAPSPMLGFYGMANEVFELPRPADVSIGESAIELLRVWRVDGVLHLSAEAGVAQNPFESGLLLADAAKVLAAAEKYHPDSPRAKAIGQIKDGLAARLHPDADEIPGNFPSVAQYSEIVKIYHGESDRAAAVLAGSFLEKYLEDCLRYFLIDHPAVDELFRNVGPFSTLAAKVQAGFAMGLINEEMYDDLRYIRKVRNHFAHHPSQTSFNDSPVKEYCSNFTVSRAMSEESPRNRYLFSISLVIAQANNIMLVSRRRIMPKTRDVQ